MRIVSTFFIFSCLVPIVVGQESTPELDERLAKLQPLMGNWETNAEWSDGSALWGRTEFSIGLNGKFIEAKTWAKDGDGEPYQRYLSIYAYDEARKEFWSHGFVYDGTQKSIPVEVLEEDGKLVMRSGWEMGGMHIKQTITLEDNKTYNWKVYSSGDEEDWTQIMDGDWKKVE